MPFHLNGKVSPLNKAFRFGLVTIYFNLLSSVFLFQPPHIRQEKAQELFPLMIFVTVASYVFDWYCLKKEKQLYSSTPPSQLARFLKHFNQGKFLTIIFWMALVTSIVLLIGLLTLNISNEVQITLVFLNICLFFVALIATCLLGVFRVFKHRKNLIVKIKKIKRNISKKEEIFELVTVLGGSLFLLTFGLHLSLRIPETLINDLIFWLKIISLFLIILGLYFLSFLNPNKKKKSNVNK